ncbi:MAG: hypothetical protein LBE79_04060 [Tannerella sp.]|jgi:hypothetical protein|nr:hypothetical protein [Tannerella sp.]
MERFTNEQIREIAETIDAAYEVCYINCETGEYILMEEYVRKMISVYDLQ